VIVVVFDLSDLKTLESCKRWLNDAVDGNNGDPYIFLVGSKRDLCVSMHRFSQLTGSATNTEELFLNQSFTFNLMGLSCFPGSQ
jgi:Ras family